jgi:hypothetical protein
MSLKYSIAGERSLTTDGLLSAGDELQLRLCSENGPRAWVEAQKRSFCSRVGRLSSSSAEPISW